MHKTKLPALPILRTQLLQNKIHSPYPEGIRELFESQFAALTDTTNTAVNPYYYPIPDPPPPPPPPPAPVVTNQTYKLHYRGFVITTHGDRFAYLDINDASTYQTIGNCVAEDLYLRDISREKLTFSTGEHTTYELTVEAPFDTPITPAIPLKK